MVDLVFSIFRDFILDFGPVLVYVNIVQGINLKITSNFLTNTPIHIFYMT